MLDGDAHHQPALPVGLPGRSARFALAGSEILGLVTRGDLAGDPGAPVPATAAPPLVGTGETPAEARARVGAATAAVLRDGRLAGLIRL